MLFLDLLYKTYHLLKNSTGHASSFFRTTSPYWRGGFLSALPHSNTHTHTFSLALLAPLSLHLVFFTLHFCSTSVFSCLLRDGQCPLPLDLQCQSDTQDSTFLITVGLSQHFLSKGCLLSLPRVLALVISKDKNSSQITV